MVKGGLVSNGERLAVLTDPDQLEVSFRISAAQYARLLSAEGQLLQSTISISLDVSGADLTATGVITRESATVGDQQTGRLLFAKLKQAQGFRPGDFVAVEVQEPTLDNIARIPASALGPQDTVLVIGEDDRLREVAIVLLRRQGDDVLIKADGLNSAAIVAARTPLLGPGIKVRAIRQGSQAAQQSGRLQTEKNVPGSDG